MIPHLVTLKFIDHLRFFLVEIISRFLFFLFFRDWDLEVFRFSVPRQLFADKIKVVIHSNPYEFRSHCAFLFLSADEEVSHILSLSINNNFTKLSIEPIPPGEILHTHRDVSNGDPLANVDSPLMDDRTDNSESKQDLVYGQSLPIHAHDD